LHNEERYLTSRYFGGQGRIWIENTFIVFQILPREGGTGRGDLSPKGYGIISIKKIIIFNL